MHVKCVHVVKIGSVLIHMAPPVRQHNQRALQHRSVAYQGHSCLLFVVRVSVEIRVGDP
jgi:hypothetical protein